MASIDISAAIAGLLGMNMVIPAESSVSAFAICAFLILFSMLTIFGGFMFCKITIVEAMFARK